MARAALGEFADRPFAAAEAMRLDEVREAALEDLFDAELVLGHHHEVVGGLEALVTNGPLCERRWGQLLLALYRDGRQAEALPGASAGVAAAGGLWSVGRHWLPLLRNLPELHVDLATMTANVAHVFVTDEELSATLRGIHGALRPGGHLVFETRDPGQRPWLRWNRDATYQRLEVPGGGSVETWWDLTEVKGDCVSYRRTYVFAADGATVTSDSTRRFWSRAEIEGSLRSAGYTLVDVRDAPDRPGSEWIFIARKPGSAP